MPDYASKDDINRFIRFLNIELSKGDRPDIQWVLYGDKQPNYTFTLQRERTAPRGIVRMTQ